MGVRGDFNSIRGLKSRIRALPLSVSHDVAQRAAPAMTALTQEAFRSGESVYGEARPESVYGGALTLEQTGATARTLRFVAAGTLVRCVLGTRYARYLIGKYGVLPNGALPARWAARLRLVAETQGPL